jgi:hypothetical protein
MIDKRRKNQASEKEKLKRDNLTKAAIEKMNY